MTIIFISFIHLRAFNEYCNRFNPFRAGCLCSSGKAVNKLRRALAAQRRMPANSLFRRLGEFAENLITFGQEQGRKNIARTMATMRTERRLQLLDVGFTCIFNAFVRRTVFDKPTHAPSPLFALLVAYGAGKVTKHPEKNDGLMDGCGETSRKKNIVYECLINAPRACKRPDFSLAC